MIKSEFYQEHSGSSMEINCIRQNLKPIMRYEVISVARGRASEGGTSEYGHGDSHLRDPEGKCLLNFAPWAPHLPHLRLCFVE